MAKPTNDTLRALLPDLEAIIAYPLYGGNEVAAAQELRARINRLLSPESADALHKEASEFLRTFLPLIEQNRKRALVQEQAQAAAGTRRHDRRLLAHRPVAAQRVRRQHRRRHSRVDRR